VNLGPTANLENVGEAVKGVVNTNYEVENLLKESTYSDTITNRIILADSYAAKEKYLQAIALYESCLTGFNVDDLITKEKLMVAKYFIQDYQGVQDVGDTLETNPSFKNSESRIVYAWSLHYSGHSEKAEEVFKAMDVRYSNYVHRYEHAKFLLELDRSADAIALLSELELEISEMEISEQQRKKEIRKEINNLLKSL
jgi:hypothetical protein